MAFAHALSYFRTQAERDLVSCDLEDQLIAANRNPSHCRDRNPPPDAPAQDELAAFQQHLAVTGLGAPLTVTCSFASHVHTV